MSNEILRLYAEGKYATAIPLAEGEASETAKTLGPDHPDTATSLNNLAALYKATGEYSKAEPLYNRALAIFEKALGPDHPDTATGLNNLASLYHDNGDYAKAEPFYERALAIRERALGLDPSPVSAPALMRELGNSPRGVSEGGA
jgi:tetratricopeptide (TPR) repeat protein